MREIGYPDTDTFSATYRLAAEWLDAFVERTGVGFERTIVGGFSQGAVMTYALGLGASRPRPAGLVALSGFMPTVEGFELDLGSTPRPRVAIGHGTFDPVIGVDWGRRASSTLEAAGFDVTYRESPLPHAIDPRFLAEVQRWVASPVPAAAAR